MSRPTHHTNSAPGPDSPPNRHRSPTRFAPHQSLLPPAYPSVQRPKASRSLSTNFARDSGASVSSTDAQTQSWFARNQQQERLWQGSSAQQAQLHRSQQQQAHHPRSQQPQPNHSQPQPLQELSTPFALQSQRSSAPEEAPSPPSPGRHSSNSWHVSVVPLQTCICASQFVMMEVTAQAIAEERHVVPLISSTRRK